MIWGETMEYKLSRFTKLYEFPDSRNIIYSFLTGAAALLNNDVYKSFANGFFDALKPDYIKTALDCGFIIPKELDETKLIITALDRKKYDSENVSITFIPTLNCNFRCPYCYQGLSTHKKEVISEQTIDKSIEFINKIIGKKTRKLTLVLYGGEPLIVMDKCIYFLSKVFELFKDSNIELSSFLFTNGYYATEENIKKLKMFNLKWCQITLDGPPSIHNIRRFEPNGDPSFERIVENIKKIPGDISILLRCNIDSHNIDYLGDLYDILKKEGLLKRVKFSPAPVTNNPENKSYNNSYCIPLTKEGKPYFLKILKTFEAKGFKKEIPDSFITLGGLCSHHMYYSFTIDPKGDIYTCPGVVGNEHFRIGNVQNKENCLLDHRYSYLKGETTSIWKNENCLQCCYLPRCLAGCQEVANSIDYEFGGEKSLCLKEFYDEIYPYLIKIKFL